MPVVLMYVQHLLGIGHLMRSRAIAQALADEGHDVHMVTGGRPVAGREPRGVKTLQLPPIHAADARLTPLLDVDGNPIDDAYKRRRTDRLLEAYATIRPDAVVFETFPFGRGALRFELLPLLDRIEATRPRPLVASSVRDILQQRSNIARLREMLDTANRAFDMILVHGDVRFAQLAETFPLAGELVMPVHHTGFAIAHDESPESRADGPRDEIVVSAGGGSVGTSLFAAALEAREQSRFSKLTWRLLVGNNVPAEAFARLREGAREGVVVERARADFPALLRRARVSVSQAGYNTVLDVVRSGAHPVLVPFAGEGETEQSVRAARFGELDLAVVVAERDVSPGALADAIDNAGTKERWGHWDFSCDGANLSARILDEGLRLRMPHAPSDGSMTMKAKS